MYFCLFVLQFINCIFSVDRLKDINHKHSSKYDGLFNTVPNYFGRYGCDTPEALFNSTYVLLILHRSPFLLSISFLSLFFLLCIRSTDLILKVGSNG